MDNIITYNASGGINILNYDGGVERQVQSQIPSSSGNITKTLLGEKCDMIPLGMSGSSYTIYYCDSGNVFADSNRVALRSYYAADDRGGLSCLYVNQTTSHGYGYDGSRLLYHGRVTMSKTSSKSLMKARSIAPVWQPIDLQYVYRDSEPVLRTGFDFNICNVNTLAEVGKLSLFGLNINYDEIEFESNALTADNEGNLTFNTDALPTSVDINYKGQLLGTLKFYEISEEELIERQREEYERQQSETE